MIHVCQWRRTPGCMVSMHYETPRVGSEHNRPPDQCKYQLCEDDICVQVTLTSTCIILAILRFCCSIVLRPLFCSHIQFWNLFQIFTVYYFSHTLRWVKDLNHSLPLGQENRIPGVHEILPWPLNVQAENRAVLHVIARRLLIICNDLLQPTREQTTSFFCTRAMCKHQSIKSNACTRDGEPTKGAGELWRTCVFLLRCMKHLGMRCICEAACSVLLIWFIFFSNIVPPDLLVCRYWR